MPQPRKPTLVLERTGTFKEKPDRRRKDPETAGPLGDPPEDFSKEEREAWDLVVSQAPLDVLTVADRQLVELTARLYHYIKITEIEDIQAAKLQLYNKCLVQMGMTPADRSRVSPKEQPKKSKWSVNG
ncbi:MAG TPA: terminase [Methylothermaceae bacterium]|nr:terminase [Methylothermaceae bacterium]